MRTSIPVKVSGIDNDTAHGGSVAVHIFGGGVGYDVGAPLEGAAVDGRSEGVVNNERHTVGMGDACELLNVEHHDTGVGYGLAEEEFGVGTEGPGNLLVGSILIDKRHLNAEFGQGGAEQVECASVDGFGCHDVSAGLTDVEAGKEVGSLTRRGEHGTYTAFEGSDACGDMIVGGILETCVEITLVLEVEETGHLFGCFITECGALDERHLAGFSLAGCIAGLNAKCGKFHIFLLF